MPLLYGDAKDCTDLDQCTGVYGCDASNWKHCTDGQDGFLQCWMGSRYDCPHQGQDKFLYF